MSSLSKRFPKYSTLLRLYPRTYRRQYGEQMLQTLADMLDNTPDRATRATIWLRTALDTPLSIVQQQAILTGHVLAHDMPGYVKRNSLAAALLLAPFCGIFVASPLLPRNVYHSWLWHTHILFAWIVLMPALALALSGGTFLVWLLRQSHLQRRSWLRGIFDIRHNWPMLAAALLGAGILGLVLFHDSAHCVEGNPFREAGEWHETLQCIRTGS